MFVLFLSILEKIIILREKYTFFSIGDFKHVKLWEKSPELDENFCINDNSVSSTMSARSHCSWDTETSLWLFSGWLKQSEKTFYQQTGRRRASKFDLLNTFFVAVFNAKILMHHRILYVRYAKLVYMFPYFGII